VESTKSAQAFDQVEGTSTIISILPEGSRVTKGRLVAELDPRVSRERLDAQKIKTKVAEAEYLDAKQAREIAELAVSEYEQGISPQKRLAIAGEIKNAEIGRARAEARLKRSQSAQKRLRELMSGRKKDLESTDIIGELDIEDRVENAEMTLAREQAALELAQVKKKVFENFEHTKTLKELRVEVEMRKRSELAKKNAWEIEQSLERRWNLQVMNCWMTSPIDGVVIYGNGTDRFGRTLESIEAGATVRERQLIFSIVDDRAPMQIKAKVKESNVDRVAPGQKVRVTVDAFADLVLTGVVDTVAPLPDPRSAGQAPAEPKVFTTLITLDKVTSGLRPGMTAQAEFLVKEFDKLLTVPTSAVLHFDGKDQVAIKKPEGGFEWRQVTLGLANEELSEVKEGIKSGDIVIETPLKLMSAQERFEKFGQPPKPAER